MPNTMPKKTKTAGAANAGGPQKTQCPTPIVPPEPAVTQPKKAAPDWLLETPMPTHYSLTMWDNEGANDQDLLLTRLEFVALKRRLAEMRGYEVPDLIPDFYGNLAPEGA